MANKKTNRLDTFNKAHQSASKMIPSWVPFTALAGTLLFALFAAALVSNQTDVVNAVGKSDVSMDFLWKFFKTNMWCKIWLGLMFLCFLVVMACWATPFIMGLIALIPVQKPIGTKSEDNLVSAIPEEKSEDLASSSLNSECRVMDESVRQVREDGFIEDDEEQIQSCRISIDIESFRKLFSNDLTDDRFNALCTRMSEKASIYSKRNYGQLAYIIMYQSRYCSTEKKYYYFKKGDKTPCFSPYCQDFYSAIGLVPSSVDRGYYETKNTVVLDEFKDILEIEI